MNTTIDQITKRKRDPQTVAGDQPAGLVNLFSNGFIRGPAVDTSVGTRRTGNSFALSYPIPPTFSVDSMVEHPRGVDQPSGYTIVQVVDGETPPTMMFEGREYYRVQPKGIASIVANTGLAGYPTPYDANLANGIPLDGVWRRTNQWYRVSDLSTMDSEATDLSKRVWQRVTVERDAGEDTAVPPFRYGVRIKAYEQLGGEGFGDGPSESETGILRVDRQFLIDDLESWYWQSGAQTSPGSGGVTGVLGRAELGMSLLPLVDPMIQGQQFFPYASGVSDRVDPFNLVFAGGRLYPFPRGNNQVRLDNHVATGTDTGTWKINAGGGGPNLEFDGTYTRFGSFSVSSGGNSIPVILENYNGAPRYNTNNGDLSVRVTVGGLFSGGSFSAGYTIPGWWKSGIEVDAQGLISGTLTLNRVEVFSENTWTAPASITIELRIDDPDPLPFPIRSGQFGVRQYSSQTGGLIGTTLRYTPGRQLKLRQLYMLDWSTPVVRDGTFLIADTLYSFRLYAPPSVINTPALYQSIELVPSVLSVDFSSNLPSIEYRQENGMWVEIYNLETNTFIIEPLTVSLSIEGVDSWYLRVASPSERFVLCDAWGNGEDIIGVSVLNTAAGAVGVHIRFPLTGQPTFAQNTIRPEDALGYDEDTDTDLPPFYLAPAEDFFLDLL